MASTGTHFCDACGVALTERQAQTHGERVHPDMVFSNPTGRNQYSKGTGPFKLVAGQPWHPIAKGPGDLKPRTKGGGTTSGVAQTRLLESSVASRLVSGFGLIPSVLGGGAGKRAFPSKRRGESDKETARKERAQQARWAKNGPTRSG